MLTNQKKWSRPGSFAFVAIVASLWVATPVLAGTVYSWTTEDGTFAYTDDAKRIPAKYRATAGQRNVGRFGDYERLTPAPSAVEKPYAERLNERLASLRESAAPESDVRALASAPSADPKLAYRLPVGGGKNRGGQGADVSIALDGGQADDEKTVIDRVRVRPEDSMATRYVTVVRKGDKIQTVIREERNHMPLDFPREKDLGIDEEPWR